MSDHIRNKMLHFQAEPPASAWEVIASALDEAPTSYPNKLYNYQQYPGNAVWSKITQQLDEENNGKVIPLKGFSKSFKYATAAAILAIVALSVFYVVQTKHNGAIAHNKANTQKAATNHTTTGTTTFTTKNNDAAIENNLQDKPTEDFKQGVFIADNNVAGSRKENKKVAIEVPIHALAAQVPDVVPQIKKIVNEEAADRYMIATNTQGDVVRLPKKAYSDFACANSLAASASAPCKQKVETLKSKMAASMTTDFAHFLDLLKNLQETR